MWRGVLGYAIVAVVFVMACSTLLSRQGRLFEDYEALRRQGAGLCLTEATAAEALEQLLLKEGYMEDEQDAHCVASWITDRLKSGMRLPNLGALNRPGFAIPLWYVDSTGGRHMRERAADSRLRLGQTPVVESIYSNALTIDDANREARGAVLDLDSMAYEETGIRVEVRVEDGSEHKPSPHVLVVLSRHTLDKNSSAREPRAVSTLAAYTFTDNEGRAVFEVPEGWCYSVIPVKDGCQYGQPRGTRDEPLSEATKHLFREREHTIPPLTSASYKRMKENHAVVVRTPEEYVTTLHWSMFLFLASWAAVYLFLGIKDFRSGYMSDRVLPLLLMMLTGLCVVMMFGMVDPLADSMLGEAMTAGVVWGVVAMCCATLIKMPLLMRQSRWLPWGCMAAAMLLVMLLYLFGTGPEGSDAKVNLWFFQPSEVSKYLIVVAFAAFFASPYGAERIQAFSRQATARTLKLQLQTVGVITLSLLLLLSLYLLLISDMGPALVVAATFILLYSIARQDLPQLLLGVVSYAAMLTGGQMLLGSSPAVLLLCVAVWFVVWTLVWWSSRKVIYESAMMMNLLLSAFAVGGNLLSAAHISGGQRLLHRMAMSGDGVWNNAVPGGDQVAQGLWALATGGLFGQGLGRGNVTLIPAFHTDMVFISIGEQLGWVALLAVVAVVTAVIHHCMKLGRRAAHPFAFFLMAGIALVTGVQFVVIVAGSLGLIPLTGVAVPFLSFGKSSLIINLAVFGIAIGASRYHPTPLQRQSQQGYNNSVACGSLAFMSLAGILLAVLWHYQVSARDEILIRPAYITTTQGERIAAYNPRIRMLLKQLHAGNIYDRNGLLLATSDAQSLLDSIDIYKAIGISEQDIETEARQRQARFYPLGKHLFFMLGDANSLELWSINDSDPYGYLAESRHESYLRGFDIYARDQRGDIITDTLRTDQYRVSPYLPPVKMEHRMARRDYSYLLDMLKEGEGRQHLTEHNATRYQRDLHLTLDATLQVRLQQHLAEQIGDILYNHGEGLKKVRGSVVILDAERGDLLCSALYPLPGQDTISQGIAERDLGLTYATAPGSTAKVVSAMAALKRNPSNANRRFDIDATDCIEPAGVEPVGSVDMETAIVRSSNCYFIRLIHEDGSTLYQELTEMYTLMGMTLNRPRSMTPYYLYINELSDDKREAFAASMRQHAQAAAHEYDLYWRRHERVRQIGHAGQRFWKMNMFETAMAWGQGDLTATPLAMARVAATIANDGRLAPTRYVKATGSGPDYTPRPLAAPIQVLPTGSGRTMAGFMRSEADKHRLRPYATALNSLDPQHTLGGKTGTPERGLGEKSNDGWYICFIGSAHLGHELAIAVRLENIGRLTSAAAVRLLTDVVLPTLNEAGYEIE